MFGRKENKFEFGLDHEKAGEIADRLISRRKELRGAVGDKEGGRALLESVDRFLKI